jgi:ribosomal protein L29
MATTKKEIIEKPLIQIDDEIREMTDEEYAAYLLDIKNSTAVVL